MTDIQTNPFAGLEPVEAPKATTAPAATDKQVAFIQKLAAERNMDFDTANLTKRAASQAIDTLMAMPKAAKPKAATAGPELEPGRVYLAEQDDRHGDPVTGHNFVRVYKSGAGRLYGKVRTWAGGWEYEDGKWLSRILPVQDPELIAKAAAAWGHEHDRCVFCYTPLSDDGDNRSVQVGYGPICAAKYSLPWG